MGLNWPQNGVNSVGSYQISGIPYFTGSGAETENLSTPKIFDLPQVSKAVTVSVVSSTTLFLGVTTNGFNMEPPHFFSLEGPAVTKLDIRTKRLVIQTDNNTQWSICASLTPITASQFPILTASNYLFEGVG